MFKDTLLRSKCLFLLTFFHHCADADRAVEGGNAGSTETSDAHHSAIRYIGYCFRNCGYNFVCCWRFTRVQLLLALHWSEIFDIEDVAFTFVFKHSLYAHPDGNFVRGYLPEEVT